jgi:hypothetical protein
MSKLMFVFAAAVSLATFTGCKKKGGAAGEAVAKMEGFQKAMCDCKDKACADKVNDDMAKWGAEMAKNAGAADKDAKPDPEMAKKSADIMTKYTECMTKLMMAGAGSAAEPPKDPEPAAGSGSDTAAPAAGSGSDAAKEEPKKEEPAMAPKKDEPKEEAKKPDDKKAGGW